MRNLSSTASHQVLPHRLPLNALFLSATLLLAACGDSNVAAVPDNSAAPGGGGGDSILPSIAITGPTSASNYTSNSANVTLVGTSSDNIGVTQVIWSNSLGGNGNATGTSNWSVGNIPLQNGTNVITVTARDAANNTGTDSISVTYSSGGGGGSDTSAPNITITAPTSASAFTSNSANVNLGGTAADNIGVTQVIWSNSLGGNGNATGTSNWSVGNITLQNGTNVITVTARDAANNTGTDTISVSYSAGGGGATEIPTAVGVIELFRYPYLQTGTATQMKFLWATTTSGSCGIQYKLSTDTAWTTQAVCSEVLYSNATTGVGTNFYQHEVTLSGLQPGSDYVYNVVHNGNILARNVGFTTLKGDDNNSVQFIVVGDSGTEYSTPRDVRDAIAIRDNGGNYIYQHDFIVGVGDIAYYDGSYAEFDFNFFGQLSGKNDNAGLNSILATRAFFPVLGNHEYANTPTSIPTAYLNSFSLPAAVGAPGEDAERYYSFDSGDAHFVVIDSEKFAANPVTTRQAQMLAWLDADLAATTKTWRIAFLHRTIFSSESHGTWGDVGENERMRQQLVPLLQNHGVQLVMFGHDHAYQRSKRMRVDGAGMIIRDVAHNIVESNAGIVYLLTGNGGADLHQCQADPNALYGSTKYNNYVSTYGDGYDFVASRNNLPVLFGGGDGGGECTGLPTSPLVADRYGFTHIAISGSSLTATAYNIFGVIMDQFTIPAN